MRSDADRSTIVTVTELAAKRCKWCGVAFPVPAGPGRKPDYCRRSHRQRHYEARTLAERRGLAANEALVERSAIQRLNDRLYVLEAACEDVIADLESEVTVDTYRDALTHLLEAALPLRNAHIEPKAASV